MSLRSSTPGRVRSSRRRPAPPSASPLSRYDSSRHGSSGVPRGWFPVQRETLFPRQKASPVRQKGSLIQGETLLVEQKASPVQRKTLSARQEGSSVQQKASLVEQKGSPVEQKGSLVQRETLLAQQKGSPAQQKASLVERSFSPLLAEKLLGSLLVAFCKRLSRNIGPISRYDSSWQGSRGCVEPAHP